MQMHHICTRQNQSMRFAIKTAPQHTTWDAMLDVFGAADEMPIFESGWTFDHFYPIFSDHTGPCLEGWIATTALAQATTRLRVGLMVTGNPYRHPAVLANMAATLDVISNGRLELGIGAGWNQQESDAYGLDLPPLKERFDRFDEALEVIHLLLTQTTSTFEGRHYQLRDAYCEPKPVQQPRIPITIGGSGEKRTLRAVARHAQHWNMAGGTPEQFTQKLEVLRRHCDELGREPSEITTSTQLRLATAADAGAVAEQAAAFGDVGCDLIVVTLQPPHTAAVLEPLASALEPLAG
jgi:F420-dependent oxidoreductase-like protein